MTVHKNYIDGKWCNSKGGKTFTSLNPSNKKVMGQFQASNSEDVEDAVKAAEKSFHEWSDKPAPERGLILLEVANLLRKNKEKLGKLVTKEMGKVLKEGLGDVQEAIDIFEYMAGEGRRLYGRTTTSELRNKACFSIRIPVGVFGIITPWNFPIAIPAWKISAALICGNTLVFKPSSDTPLCAVELVKILEKAGIPSGVVNLVTGSAREVGNVIVKHPRIRGISFTGSRDTGLYITREAGLKKVGLELGGKNPIIVMDDADINLAAEGILWSAFGTTGQRCTACSRVIVHKKIKDKLEKELVNRAKKMRLGDGLKKGIEVGPLINEAALDKTKRYVEIGKREGKLICGGNLGSKKGYFFEPTIFTDVKVNNTIAQDEIFGPVLSIISVDTLDEAIKAANSVKYGLSSSIYTNNINNSFKSMNKIESGITYINSSTIGAEVHLPFGGVKDTGHTREAGWSGIDEFSHEKVIYVDYSNKLQKAQGID
ncbi:MAG: aldehyde dehydrogenase family protein [Candidatus Woesearchaeota archaeon]|nr:MAG: aldehyde dehydrogenase family protein [Candidatus Woesearchaeota archaeon]